MALQSAKDAVLDSLKDSRLSSLMEVDDEMLEEVAEGIVKNLCIEYDKFPKWE